MLPERRWEREGPLYLPRYEFPRRDRERTEPIHRRRGIPIPGLAIALSGNNQAKASGTSTATTASADTTGATLLTVVVSTFALSAITVTISDSKGNSWSRDAANSTNGNANVAVFWSLPTAVGAGHTVSCNPNGSGYPCIFFAWWTGTQNIGRDQANAANNASGTTIASGSVTPTAGGSLVIVGLGTGGNAPGTTSIDSGFTIQDSQNNNSFSCGVWAYLIQSVAAAVNPTWTTVNAPKATRIDSFLAAVSGGGPLIGGALLSDGRGLVVRS
jgi:hypothetical protein